MKRVLIVAGEASADICGAEMVESLAHDARFVGVGGEKMRAAGAELVFGASEFSLFGVGELIGKLREVWGKYRRLVRLVKTEKWDAAVLIDLPDINLRLAKHLKRRGIPVCYYVSPQLWAWRSGRINQIRRSVDQMLVLFPFEEGYYRKRSVNATFVGHPLTRQLEERNPVSWGGTIRFGVLPGSRWSEIRYHVPILARAIRILQARYPGAAFEVPVPTTLDGKTIEDLFRQHGALGVEITANSLETFRTCHVALVASGTATLEAALIGIPFCIFYRVSRSSKFLYDLLIDVPHIGMPNLLVGREIVREFFQERATPDALAAEAIRLVEEVPYRDDQIGHLRECRRSLEKPKSAHDAAGWLGHILNENHERLSPASRPH
ncbi:MAG: lipid-A-disaccharide synthase [Deltaproteobacteria bacterium]|nr:lipid-A-disaccharide synthase [Deltaproteobacteria bacterium]MBI3293808.1 lipid-A-disaccharide synthase [Deltaproteobacteria bacterium]